MKWFYAVWENEFKCGIYRFRSEKDRDFIVSITPKMRITDETGTYVGASLEHFENMTGEGYIRFEKRLVNPQLVEGP